MNKEYKPLLLLLLLASSIQGCGGAGGSGVPEEESPFVDPVRAAVDFSGDWEGDFAYRAEGDCPAEALPRSSSVQLKLLLRPRMSEDETFLADLDDGERTYIASVGILGSEIELFTQPEDRYRLSSGSQCQVTYDEYHLTQVNPSLGVAYAGRTRSFLCDYFSEERHCEIYEWGVVHINPNRRRRE